jgi:hypothetical protein
MEVPVATKYNLLVRNLFLSREMLEVLEDAVIDEEKVAPGQLRKRGEWFVLTYLRVVTLKNFDPIGGGQTEQEVNTIRATVFRPYKTKLLVQGSATEVKEIVGLLEALALKLAGNKPTGDAQSFNASEFFKLEEPTVDLKLVLDKYEKKSQVADVRKVRLRDLEIRLGTVNRCVVNTHDYGAVRKIIEQPDHKALGIELAMRDPAKSYLYVDLEGQVKVTCQSDADENEVEALALETALML